MRSQQEDLDYGYERERINHPILEEWLGIKFEKLDKFHTMDWCELQEEGDETPAWWVEQKARKITYDFCNTYYKYNGKATALIGKHKIEFMKQNGNGIVLIDFTDKLMYWVFDEKEYETFDIQKKFVRNERTGYVDKPADVVHIPLSALREVPK